VSQLDPSQQQLYKNGDHAISELVEAQSKELCKKHFGEMVSSPPLGPLLPRYNIFTTNLAEGKAIWAINNGARL